MSLTYFKRFRMEIDLSRPLFSRPPLPDDYDLIPWSHELIEEHAEAKYSSFHTELDANVFPCLGERTGCLHLMHEIACKESFVPEATWLVRHNQRHWDQLHWNRGESCGTVQGVRDRGDYGAIQNLGIVLEHRNLKLGSCLMHAALQGFLVAGLRRAMLEVTAQNRNAIRLYQRMGFAKVRTVYKAVEVAYS